MDPYSNQTPQQNPYDFILNPSQPPKKQLFGGGSMKSRIIIVAVGLILLMIIGAIISSLIANANKGPTEQLKSIVAQQQEIIRIANSGTDSALTSTGRSFAATVKMSIQTDQKNLRDQLSTTGIGLKPEELSSKRNSKTDEALKAAADNNRYDEELIDALSKMLNTYAKDLKSAFDATKNQDTKQVLSDAYSSAVTILNL